MKRIIDPRPLNADIASLLLRLIFGGMFIYFGYQKIVHYDTYITMFGDPIGLGNKLSYDLLIFAEFFCGIFIVLGFLARVFVIPTFIAMCVAYFVAHANDPFEKSQYAFVYMLLCLPVFVLGSGRFSIDGLIFKKRFYGKA
jgi:putative oxidoreductase